MSKSPWCLSALAALAGLSIGGAMEAQASLPIRDNSFLIEEAYNQEWGVIQHIFTFDRLRGVKGWAATFTEEWPAPSERHQLSVTVPIDRIETGNGLRTGMGDVALNYRFQVPVARGSRLAFAPRLSALLPTGRAERGHGSGAFGVQGNLPVSVELGAHLVTHLNLGGSVIPSASAPGGGGATVSGFFAGQSLILLLHQKLNLMLEAVYAETQAAVGNDETASSREFLIVPGLRAAIDFASGLQIVPGVAVPIGVGPSSGDRHVFVYLSLEHPVRRR
jgi:hypothetical protein